MSDPEEQEKLNEWVYEKQYLKTTEPESFLKEGETSPCPFCLNDITSDQSHHVLIGYTISNDNSSGSTHMEIYHEKCWKQIRKEIYEIERRMQDGKR